MTTSSSRADVGSDHDIITDFGITRGTLDMLVLSGMTSADIVLTDVAGGAEQSDHRAPRRAGDARSDQQAGAVTSTNAPAESGALIAAQTQRWQSVARTSNIGVA